MPPKKKGKENVLLKTNVYPDKAKIEATSFAELEVKINDVETAILLLSSADTNVLIRVLHHLDEFGQKQIENATLLQEFELIEKILHTRLLAHPDLFVKRFSLKLISRLIALENLKLDKAHLEHIFVLAKEYFVQETDNFVVEYCAVILVSLLKEPRFVIDLEQDESFVPRILGYMEYTDDPDILFNCYQMIILLFKSVIPSVQICSVGRFPFERVLADVCSEFADIQKSALHTFKAIVHCQSDYYIGRFCCPIFFNEMLKVLENPGWMECHLDVIDVLEQIMSIEKVATEFCNDGFVVRFLSYMKLEDAFKMQAGGVLAEILRHSSLFDILYNFGVTEILLEFLDKNDSTITVEVLLGVKRFLNHLEAFMKIVNHNPVGQLLKIIRNETTNMKTRETSADTLQVLTSRNKKMCESALKDFGPIASRIFERPFGEITPDFILHILQILNNLAKYHDMRSRVMDAKMAASLVTALKNSFRSSLLLANLMNCICVYICEYSLQEELLRRDVASLVLRSLRNSAVIVKTSATDLIMLTAKNPVFSEVYVEHGVLDVLLEDDKSLVSCPSWSLAIDAILSANPSLKFAIRGRLEITDLSGDDFIVSKKPMNDFRIFRSCIKDEVSPLTSFLLMNFDHLKCPSATVVHLTNCCEEGRNNSVDMSFSDLDDWCYCRRPNDENLPRALKEVREMLEIKGLMERPESKSNLIDITKIADRAKVIAEIVAREMCGNTPGIQSEVCSEPVILSHLNYLKCHLHCNIIPLGLIRFGGQFERAIYFKGLADQIGLPCSLQRGTDGRVMYNEIPLPVDEKGKCCLKVLPTRLLQPSHIVDLMDNPGMLYPIESRQAYQYLQLL